MEGTRSQGCQYIGANQTRYPFTFCGCKTLDGKNYCGDHYWKVYAKGSAVAGRRRERAVEKEIEELKRAQELEELNDD